MKNDALVVCAVLVVAGSAGAQSVKEKKARTHVDDRLAESAARVTGCGKTLKLVYDWKAYDALDFAKLGRDKLELYGYEASNVQYLGDAINKLCADKDYLAVISKLDTVIYVPTANDKITVKATVAGATLTIENFSGGSTRGASDYQKAMKDAL